MYITHTTDPSRISVIVTVHPEFDDMRPDDGLFVGNRVGLDAAVAALGHLDVASTPRGHK